MAPRTVAANPDDLIAHGRFLQEIADGGPSGDAGLAHAIEIVRTISIPIPDETAIPGGAAFARGLTENTGMLLEALEELAAGFRGLGEGVEQVGQSTRSAEEVRAAAATALGSKLPPPRPTGASPLAVTRPEGDAA